MADFVNHGKVEFNQKGKHVIGQQLNDYGSASAEDWLDRLPLNDLGQFIRASKESLEVLGLSQAALTAAQGVLADIRAEVTLAGPDTGRLQKFGALLRDILSEAAGHALGGAVLGVWHP